MSDLDERLTEGAIWLLLKEVMPGKTPLIKLSLLAESIADAIRQAQEDQ